jgi:putative transcriptional regulator
MDDDMKKTLFDDLLNSIDEARRHARGEFVPGLKIHTRKVEKTEVAALRLKAGMTQAEFARMLGASIGTVRKWEMGERSPSGAAATLLRVLDFDPATVTRALGITTVKPRRTPRSKLIAAE